MPFIKILYSSKRGCFPSIEKLDFVILKSFSLPEFLTAACIENIQEKHAPSNCFSRVFALHFAKMIKLFVWN